MKLSGNDPYMKGILRTRFRCHSRGLRGLVRGLSGENKHYLPLRLKVLTNRHETFRDKILCEGDTLYLILVSEQGIKGNSEGIK